MTDCSLCGKNEALVCPDCLYKQIVEEIDKWQNIISQIQKDHIIPKWPEKYQHDPTR